VDAGAGTVELDPLPGRWPVVAGGHVGVVHVTAGPAGATAEAVWESVDEGGRGPLAVRLRPAAAGTGGGAVPPPG